MQHLDHAVGVEGARFAANRHRALVTAARVNLEQTIEERIDALVAALRSFGINVRDARDFLGEVAIP